MTIVEHMKVTKRALTWSDISTEADRICARWCNEHVDRVYGIPRGGIPAAVMVSERLGVPLVEYWDSDSTVSTLVVDDVVDSGKTWAALDPAPVRFDALYRKPHSPAGAAPGALELDAWLVFPWERGTEDNGPADAVVRLLAFVGEDPTREGLLETPRRVLSAFEEMTAGYNVDVGALLSKQFAHDGYTGMIVSSGIDFVSMCEHHLLPFTGTATVAYVPSLDTKAVVGLSKLARVVDAYARRLQMQERMTEQIADALVDYLAPQGVGVLVRAHHACMSCRGVRKANAQMVTSSLRGLLFEHAPARAEFMALAAGQ